MYEDGLLEATREAFSVVPDYLRSTEGVPNLMDYGIALGRRFRALKLWMVMRSMGISTEPFGVTISTWMASLAPTTPVTCSPPAITI